MLAWLIWPLGVLLTVLYGQEHVVPLGVYLVLDALYVVAAVLLIRRAGWLLAPAAVLFAVASATGAPTAGEPGLMVLNAGALMVVALVLLIAFALWTVRLWDSPARPAAALASLVLAVGTAGYLANLVARFAVVLAGAAQDQAAVEGTAWQAYEYLRGLPSAEHVDFMVVLLVWLDLLQILYVVLAYAATALLTVALGRAGLIAPRTGPVLAGTGVALALVGGAVTGTQAGGYLAFGLTIPFMTTLLPTALSALVSAAPDRPGASDQLAAKRGRAVILPPGRSAVGP